MLNLRAEAVAADFETIAKVWCSALAAIGYEVTISSLETTQVSDNTFAVTLNVLVVREWPR